VPGERALLLEDGERTLVLADLHIGIEAEYREGGVTLPSQTPSLIERVRSLVGSVGPDSIVLLGDVKNTIGGVARQEVEEVPVFLKAVADMAPVHIIPGNHDGSLSRTVPGWGGYDRLIAIRPARGVVLDGVGLFHGHTYPSPEVAACPVLVIGHQHPAVAFRDDLGTLMTEACWVRAPLREDRFRERFGGPPAPGAEVIVMPAFSEYGQGSPVNGSGELLGPFLKGIVDIDAARVFLLDGVELGALADLRSLLRGPDATTHDPRRAGRSTDG